MASVTHQKAKRKTKAYSADMIALRLVAGMTLIALGVIVFLAVDLGVTGNTDIFLNIKSICCGISGRLAILLAIFPVWGGILLAISAQRAVPVRAFWFSSLAYLLLCTFMTSTETTGKPVVSLLDFISQQGVQRDQYVSYLYQGYRSGVDLYGQHAGGGILGMLLSWPFWRLFSVPVVCAVLSAVGALFCALQAVGLTPGKIRDLISGKGLQLRASRQREQQDLDRRQIEMQQDDAMRQRQAYEEQMRQQAYTMQQQQQAWARQQSQMNISRTGSRPAGARTQSGMQEEYARQQDRARQQAIARQQAQVTSRTAGMRAAQPMDPRMQGTGRRHIFEDTADQADRTEKKPFLSRIFHQESFDGLSEAPAVVQRRPDGDKDRASDNTSRTVRRVEYADHRAEPEADDNRRVNPTVLLRRQDHWETETQTPEKRTPAPEQRNQKTQDPAPLQEEKVISGNRERRSTEESAWQKQLRDAMRSSEAPGEKEKETSRPSLSEWEKRDVPQCDRTEPAVAGTEPAPVRPASTAFTPAPATVPRETAVAGENGDPKPSPFLDLTVPAGNLKSKPDVWQPELKLPPKPEKEDAEDADEEETAPVYVFPSIDLISPPKAEHTDTSAEDGNRARILEETLESFRVRAKVVNVTHGPAISRFELQLEAGIKVNKITELVNDIAMNMEATSVRIEAPIPGKSLVGVEVPNRKVTPVTLREVLESEPMRTAKSPLSVALGKDIAGTPIICDLARMPHLLIAGATGSGKSVCINTIINSLLFRCSPQDVRLILVDPKVVELQCYNGIPHLLIPVVNDPHKAAAALQWAVAEMMNRYDRFAERFVRSIDGYNAALQPGEEKMPRIVVIIDELADLMMVCKKDVEDYICRLTQLARAAGIHLIVATQRPSVDVITGLIKANIPSRIAFKTASYVDSRTILDRNGSEQLLGWGDMLYLPTGAFAPTRIQGCYLSDGEVKEITDFIHRTCPTTYDPNILEQMDELSKKQETQGADTIGGILSEDAGGDAGLLEQCIEMTVQEGQISTSTIQRRLKIGYARAGRLTDEMEERGIVSAKDGSKPRKCLITREEWERMKQNTQEE